MFKPILNNSYIGIISPAFIPIKERLQKGIEYLQQKGFRVKTGANMGKEHAYFAGNDEQRVSDLHQLFADQEVDLIICARGGWGGLRLLDKIDYELIKNNPKPLVGYSDITTLQIAIWKNTQIPSFSGPMVAVEMGKGIVPFTEKHFWDQINNEKTEYYINLTESGGKTFVPGIGSGLLLGGCLSLVSHLLGTPYSPDFDGAILFIEDVGEKPYKIDRYFAHLKQAGVFNKINGLILGDFIDCEADPDEVSFSLQELIEQYFSDANYPVLTGFPYGHGDKKITMPVGVQASLDTTKNELIFANPFV